MTTCLHCGIETTNPKFCSKSCSAKETNKLRPPGHSSRTKGNESRREKASKNMVEQYASGRPLSGGAAIRKGLVSVNYVHTCPICHSFFVGGKRRKTCSKICAAQHSSITQSKRLADPDYRIRHNYGRQSKSWMEISFAEWLDAREIEYEAEKKFHNADLRKTYFVDFFFGTKKLVIELDGNQHKNTVDKDAIRDSFLSSLGYTVIRITHKEYIDKSKLDLVISLLQ